MLISCPKCNSVYNVSDTRIPADGKKFKCAECGEVWKVFPQNTATDGEPRAEQKSAEDVRSEASENDDINKMFSRLSRDTKNLFPGDAAEQKTAYVSPAAGKHITGFFTSYAFAAFLLVTCIALALYLAYINRYNAVASFPEAEKIYEKFGIESVYGGRGLEFRDVDIKNVQIAGENALAVSGRLYNAGDAATRSLPVKATFIGADGKAQSEVTDLLPPQYMPPRSSMLFRIVAGEAPAGVKQIKLDLENVKEN